MMYFMNPWSRSLSSSRICWHVNLTLHMLQPTLLEPWVWVSYLDRFIVYLPDLMTSLLSSCNILHQNFLCLKILRSCTYIAIMFLNFFLGVLPWFELNLFSQYWQLILNCLVCILSCASSDILILIMSLHNLKTFFFLRLFCGLVTNVFLRLKLPSLSNV